MVMLGQTMVAEVGSGDAGIVPEEAGEVGGVFVSQLVGDLADVDVGIVKESFGFDKDLLADPVTGREAGYLFEGFV